MAALRFLSVSAAVAASDKQLNAGSPILGEARPPPAGPVPFAQSQHAFRMEHVIRTAEEPHPIRCRDPRFRLLPLVHMATSCWLEDAGPV